MDTSNSVQETIIKKLKQARAYVTEGINYARGKMEKAKQSIEWAKGKTRKWQEGLIHFS